MDRRIFLKNPTGLKKREVWKVEGKMLSEEFDRKTRILLKLFSQVFMMAKKVGKKTSAKGG